MQIAFNGDNNGNKSCDCIVYNDGNKSKKSMLGERPT